MIVIPTIVLMCTTYKVTKLLNVTTSATTRVLNNVRCKERLKRNQSITRMLIGIIMMFLICHTGKVCNKENKVCFLRKFLQNHLAHKIHNFCPIHLIDFNGVKNVNFVCQMVLQVFSYKKQTLVIHRAWSKINFLLPPSLMSILGYTFVMLISNRAFCTYYWRICQKL